MLRGVAGGVLGGNGNLSELDGVAVVEAGAVEIILPVVPAFAGEVYGGAGYGRQFAGS